MPFPVAAAIAAGASLLGQGAQMQATKLSNTKNFNRTKQLMDKQQGMNQQMALFNAQQQVDMWKQTGPVGQMEQLTKAGLNPGLIYGMGGAGGQTAQAAQAAPVSGGSYHGENPGQGLAQTGAIVGEQLALMTAQRENIQADTANKLKQADVNAGEAINKPLTGEQIKAQTNNLKAAQGGIQASSDEATEYLNRVKRPNRGIEAKTYEDELSARQGVADTIYELWQEGKLKEKSLAEVENVVLQNAKTGAETRNINKMFDMIESNLKGQNLENALKEVDLKLSKIGVGRNANTAERIIGTIYNELMKR